MPEIRLENVKKCTNFQKSFFRLSWAEKFLEKGRPLR